MCQCNLISIARAIFYRVQIDSYFVRDNMQPLPPPPPPPLPAVIFIVSDSHGASSHVSSGISLVVFFLRTSCHLHMRLI